MSSALDLNNFYYRVDIGRDLNVPMGTSTLRDLVVTESTTLTDVSVNGNTILADVVTGNLTVPAGKKLELVGDISANNLAVTPEQLSILNNVAGGQLPASAVSGIVGFYVDVDNNQLVEGVKTFLDPPVMSGNSITAGTIGQTQVSNGYVALSGNQTVGGIKNFSSPPVMSGASITTASIPQSAIAGGGAFVDLTSNQSISGTKTYTTVGGVTTTSSPIINSQYLNASFFSSATSLTLTTPIYQVYCLSPPSTMTITLPTPSATFNGQVIHFFRSGTPSVLINSASSNILDATLTYTNVILKVKELYKPIVCMFTATTGYNWYYLENNSSPILQSNNIWTGQNSFDTSLPQSTLAPVFSNDLVNKEYHDSIFTTSNTYEGTNTIRSSWATGGAESMGLYRNIGQILTPFAYNPTTRRISLNDEITGEQWAIDFSNNTMISGLDLNNFYYGVDIGRDLNVPLGTSTLKDLVVTNSTNLTDVTVSGTVSGTTTLEEISVTGTSVLSEVSVTGNTILTGVLVTGSLNTDADVVIGTNLTVVTDANVNADLTVEGVSRLNGNVEVQGTLEARGLTRLAESICLSGGMDINFPNLTTTTSIGPNTMSVCPSTAYADDVTAIGSGVLEICGSTHTGTVAIGRQALGQATNLGNNVTAIGFRAAYNVENGANISNCTFIGPNTGVSNPNGTYTNSLCIGASATITFSNQVVLGGSGLLVVIPSNLQLQSKFIERASGTVRSAAFSLTSGSAVLFTYYSIHSGTSFAITFPAAAFLYLGTRISFRRVSGDPLNAITSASNNIYPLNSNTQTNQLLPANVYAITVVCLLISGTTYGWFQI
jgi:hypothetical protein